MDPDETAHYELSHMDQVFANSAIVVFGTLRVKTIWYSILIEQIFLY